MRADVLIAEKTSLELASCPIQEQYLDNKILVLRAKIKPFLCVWK